MADPDIEITPTAPETPTETPTGQTTEPTPPAPPVYSMAEWLKGMVADFDVSDASIKAILYNNHVDGTLSVDQIDERSKDLSLADLYMALATSSSKTGSVYDADGGWQRGRSTKNVVDRRWFRDQANRLYLKWDPSRLDGTGAFVLKGIY